MSTDITRPDYLRMRAERLRAMAENAERPSTKKVLAELADTYQKFAEMEQRWRGFNPD